MEQPQNLIIPAHPIPDRNSNTPPPQPRHAPKPLELTGASKQLATQKRHNMQPTPAGPVPPGWNGPRNHVM